MLLFTLPALLLFFFPSFGKSSYSEAVAAKLANLSSSAYFASSTLEQPCIQCYQTFTINNVIEEDNLLVLIGYQESLNSVIAVFRGTISLANIMTDIAISPVPYHQKQACYECYLHQGFLTSYDSLSSEGLEDSILSQLAQHKTESVILSGHSLGGAIASYSGIRLYDHCQQSGTRVDIKAYTFGQPRVGNSAYANYYNKRIKHYYRVIHAADIIPHKLSNVVYTGFYQHAGQQVWYPQNMNKIKGICQGQSEECSNSLGKTILEFSFFDHNFVEYGKLYQRFLNQQNTQM